MKNYNYWARLKKVCEFRKLNVDAMSELVDAVRKRASGDRAVAETFQGIISKLEPSVCSMPHCESYTAYGFCNCRLGLVPSRCKKHKEFQQRQYSKMEKVYLEGREAMKNTASLDKVTNPYKQHEKYIWNRDKFNIFCQGVFDEYNNLPMRSMSDWKLKLEWGNPTDETIEEYFYFEHRSNAITALAEKLEISRFDIIRYNNYENKDKRIADVYFITKPINGCGYWANAKALKKTTKNED